MPTLTPRERLLAETEDVIAVLHKAVVDIRHTIDVSRDVLRQTREIVNDVNAVIASSQPYVSDSRQSRSHTP